ncbi:MAG: hypothetical protein MZV65_25915 [Chromatiales bacterium]|nr:hypothetical protein [Chromatiales bacterium]
MDRALEAAAKIQTPAKAIEDRYVSWLRRQPGLHPMQIVFASIGVADIERHAETARERIAKHAEGMAAFGSYTAAMSDTPAEGMVFETIGAVLDGEELWKSEAGSTGGAVCRVGQSGDPDRVRGRTALLVLAVWTSVGGWARPNTPARSRVMKTSGSVPGAGSSRDC